MRRTFVAIAGVLAVLGTLAPPALAAQPAGGPDLTVSVVGPSSTPLRGESFTAVATVTNQGSGAATEVTLATWIPDGLRLDSTTPTSPLTCSAGPDRELTCGLSALAPGASASVRLNLTRTASRETWIDAWTSSAEEDSNYENNYGGIAIAPDRTNAADVAVQVAKVTEQPDVGQNFDYTATVTNRGPERAHDVIFTMSLSERVTFVGVKSSDPTDECSLHEETYDGHDLEGGPYYYREVRCSLGTMEFAEQATITTTVTRNDPHELWGSAWVGTSSYDATYENDYAEASTAGHPSVTSDLQTTLTQTGSTARVGDEFEYTVSVTNTGPAPAPDVSLGTWIPAELAIRSVAPSAGITSCEQDQYAGVNCQITSLAVGQTESVTIAVTRVRAREFWFGGSAYSPNFDPDYEDSYVEQVVPADTSTPADLGVTLDAPLDPAVGSNYDYTATVKNNGPMAASGSTFAQSLPQGVTWVGTTSSDATDKCVLHEEMYLEEKRIAPGEPTPPDYVYREVRCELGTLAPGESTTITTTVTRDNEFQQWTDAWVATASYDPNFENDYAGSASDGKSPGGCASDAPVSSDEMTVIDCAYAGGSDRDQVSYEATSKAIDPVIRLGRGSDTLSLRIPTSSKKHRTIEVRAGRGNDSINVLLPPGAGNVTVVVRGGRGRDYIGIKAPNPGPNVRFKTFGGAGHDLCEREVGDRYRKSAC